jgi:hypothetical protein
LLLWARFGLMGCGSAAEPRLGRLSGFPT